MTGGSQVADLFIAVVCSLGQLANQGTTTLTAPVHAERRHSNTPERKGAGAKDRRFVQME